MVRLILGLLVVFGVIGVGFFFANQAVYFVGTDSAGRVAVFNGLPYDLPAAIKLYSTVLRLRRHRRRAPSARAQPAAQQPAALASTTRPTSSAGWSSARYRADEQQPMNRPIARLFGLVIVLFLLLIGFTSRWTVFEAQSLRDNPLNARGVLEQQLIPRGSIRADDGSVLARSTRGQGRRVHAQLSDR